jgi:hypothetical protein
MMFLCGSSFLLYRRQEKENKLTDLVFIRLNPLMHDKKMSIALFATTKTTTFR